MRLHFPGRFAPLAVFLTLPVACHSNPEKPAGVRELLQQRHAEVEAIHADLEHFLAEAVYRGNERLSQGVLGQSYAIERASFARAACFVPSELQPGLAMTDYMVRDGNPEPFEAVAGEVRRLGGAVIEWTDAYSVLQERVVQFEGARIVEVQEQAAGAGMSAMADVDVRVLMRRAIVAREQALPSAPDGLAAGAPVRFLGATGGAAGFVLESPDSLPSPRRLEGDGYGSIPFFQAFSEQEGEAWKDAERVEARGIMRLKLEYDIEAGTWCFVDIVQQPAVDLGFSLTREPSRPLPSHVFSWVLPD
ncbi:MAG: hypothetical protein R3F17_01430 [Planctomycetota bacterium]